MNDIAAQTLDDFLVHVTDADITHTSYRVQISLDGGRHFEGKLNLQGLRAPAGGSSAALASYGLDLFGRLFAPPLDDVFFQALGAAQTQERGLRLRLWLDSSQTSLHEIPWELLHYDPSGGRARPMALATSDSITFSRYLAGTEKLREPISHRPLRLLLIVSAPADLGSAWPDLVPIDKQAELDALQEPLNQMRNTGQLVYTCLEHATEDNLHAALLEGYDVLLYFGHAMHHPRLGTRLVLEDSVLLAGQSSGNAVLYPGERLVYRLQQSQERPALFILVACNTAAQQTADQADEQVLTRAPTSLAARLVQQGGVPAVLAMQHLVDIQMARTFSHYLNDYLLQHGLIDKAVSDVRQMVYQADQMDWSTPVLYMRSSDGRLFAPDARLEYVEALLRHSSFERWRGPEFIRMETITMPPGQPWRLLQRRPQDAPLSSDALDSLRRALHLDDVATTPSTPSLVALLGSPRSGQTTTLQRLAWDLASEARQHPASEQVVAVFVPLAGYEQQSGSNRLEQHIMQAASELVPAMKDELQALFSQPSNPDQQPAQSARYAFLLDGLDVIPQSYRLLASNDIVAFSQRLYGQRVVVSCIEDYFPAMVFRQATLLVLQPLNERLILRYLRARAPEQSSRLCRRMVEDGLIEVATDPALLTLVYERLVSEQARHLTRNQLLRSILDEALSRVSTIYTHGDAARQSLYTLAWEFLWRNTILLPLHTVFEILADVRRGRDYSLEGLYHLFREAGLLAEVGQAQVRFVYPALQAYCAALALQQRPDFEARLREIIFMCGLSERVQWWQDTLIALAGMLDRPDPLTPLVETAIREDSGTYTLLIARLSRALSERARSHLTPQARLLLFDIGARHLRAEREPSAERRAQIATALGYLHHPKVVEELLRLLTQRVLVSPQGLRYERPPVRIAAARALRTLFTRAAEDQDSTLARDDVQHLDAALQQIDPPLRALFEAWNQGVSGTDNDERQLGRATLRAVVLTNSSKQSPLIYAVAAFALGDMALDEAEDAGLLFARLVRPRPASLDKDEWAETMWGAAGALTLFDAEYVADLISRFFHVQHRVPSESIQQLAYIAGRVRIDDEKVQRWLVDLLLHNPDLAIKARALQSLAWLGQALQSLDWLADLLYRAADDDSISQDSSLARDIVQAIASWDLQQLASLGTFAAPANEQEAAYLLNMRRIAIEAMALVGDQQTLTKVDTLVSGWPLELREAWHSSALVIRNRLRLEHQHTRNDL